MTRPIVSDLTERIYELLEPLHADDEAYGYGMLILSSAAAAMMEESFGWSNGDDGSEPWQHLVDSSTLSDGSPNQFLAQILGLSVSKMEPSMMLMIMDQKLAHMRGTVAYLEALLAFAMGEDAVGIYERTDASLADDPYGIVLRTRGPMPDDVLLLMQRWKPAGLIVYVIDDPGPTYFDIAASALDYDAFEAEVTTYDSIVDWLA